MKGAMNGRKIYMIEIRTVPVLELFLSVRLSVCLSTEYTSVYIIIYPGMNIYMYTYILVQQYEWSTAPFQFRHTPRNGNT